MIKLMVSDLMGKHKMNGKQLSEATGIRPATVSALYHEKTKRVDLDMIDALCRTFNCGVGDIMKHVPDEE